MNKKGFTLIEILAIVVLIGVIGVIAIPNITKQAEEHTYKQNKLTEEKLLNAAKIYASMDIKINGSTYKIDNTQSSNIEKLINCANGTTCLTMLIYSEDSEKDTLVKRELLAFSENEIEAYKDNYVIVVRKEGKQLIYDIPKISTTGSSPAITTAPSVSVTTTKKATSDDTAIAITKQEALLLTADAFFKQGKQVQYDSYKRNLKCTPEDATSKHYCYVNCSGFVHMVHKYALNYKIPNITKDLINYESYVDYKDNITDNSGLAKFFSDNLKSSDDKKRVTVGDVIVWETKGGARHTMLVEKVDVANKEIHVIQAGGGAAETEGRYNTITSEDVYDDYGALSREYIKIETSNNISIGTKTNRNNTFFRKKVKILRFWDDEGYSVTKSSEIRKKFKDIYVAKIVTSPTNQNYARVGQKITYALKIKNNSDKTYENLYIEEILDNSLVELETKTITKGTVKDVGTNKIRAEISTLGAGEEVTLKYTVKVNGAVNSIIVSEGVVGTTPTSRDVIGIKTSKIETIIGKGLTDEQKEKLWNSFDITNLEKTSTSIASRRFIHNLYKNSLGIDLGLIVDNKVIPNNTFITYNKDLKNDSDKVKYTQVLAGNFKNYLYSNFYGLTLLDTDKLEGDDKASYDEDKVSYYVSTGTVKDSVAWKQDFHLELNDRARTITSDMLEDGDVILTHTSGGDAGYIFFKGTLYKYDGKLQSITGDALFDFLNNLVGRNYIILRPYK